MPLLGFTAFKDELLSGKKAQTIRRPRKRPLKTGDKLYIYWHPRQKDCEKLGESIVLGIVRKKAWQLTEKDALLDGFKPTNESRHVPNYTVTVRHSALHGLQCWLRDHYPKLGPTAEYDIISFLPLKIGDWRVEHVEDPAHNP